MAPTLPQAALAQDDSLKYRRSASPTKSGRAEKSPRSFGEKVQTAVRLRPFLNLELAKIAQWERRSEHSSYSCVEMKPDGHVTLHDPEKPNQPGRDFECTFAFDSSQPQSSQYADQSTIFEGVGADMVMHGTTGYNCCLVAYGQTGTGKTHTVHGDWQSHEHRGLLPRIAEGLFARLGKLAEGDTWRVRISYVEVYKDRLRDLLSGTRMEYESSPRSTKGALGGKGLEVRAHPEIGVFVENLQELPVESFRDVARHVARGERAKKIESTTMNNRSSRSHTIFSFKVEVRGTGHNSLSTMQVVDLAGRENEQTSECKDERFRELRFINRSLFELANCISALCDGNREHVPFRNSKLTMLLSDSLSSNSRTTLLATLTPSPTGFDENMLTCRFLESAGRVTTQPVANRFAAAEVARRLQDEIASLKPMVVEPNTPLADELTLRETLLRQFSLVWAEDGQDHEATDEVTLVQGACKQPMVSSTGLCHPQCAPALWVETLVRPTGTLYHLYSP